MFKKVSILGLLMMLNSGCSANINQQSSPLHKISGKLVPKISFTQAISIAEAESGGLAYEAELENIDGVLFYEIDTITPTSETEMEIDALTGQIIDSDLNALDEEDSNLHRKLRATAGLADVVSIAEGSHNGNLLSVSLDYEDGNNSADIEFGYPTRIEEFEVNIRSRTVSKDTEEDEE